LSTIVCLFVFFLLSILLSVIPQLAAFEYPFGIDLQTFLIM